MATAAESAGDLASLKCSRVNRPEAHFQDDDVLPVCLARHLPRDEKRAFRVCQQHTG